MRTSFPFTFEGFLVEICGNVTSCRWKSSVCVAIETEEKILQWVDNLEEFLVEGLSDSSGVEHKVDSSMKSHISESPKSSSEEVSSSTVVLEQDNHIASSRC